MEELREIARLFQPWVEEEGLHTVVGELVDVKSSNNMVSSIITNGVYGQYVVGATLGELAVFFDAVSEGYPTINIKGYPTATVDLRELIRVGICDYLMYPDNLFRVAIELVELCDEEMKTYYYPGKHVFKPLLVEGSTYRIAGFDGDFIFFVTTAEEPAAWEELDKDTPVGAMLRTGAWVKQVGDTYYRGKTNA